MALQVLPFDANDTKYTVDVTLSGVVVRFAVNWNDRGAFWAIDVTDVADNPIVQSIKLVADWELWGQYVDPRLPPGPLYCVDLSGTSADPGLADLGTRVIVMYDDGT